jgi:hypothetical protein
VFVRGIVNVQNDMYNMCASTYTRRMWIWLTQYIACVRVVWRVDE